MEPQTLVLTPAMAPIRIACWEESVVLVWQGKADALELYEATVSSPSITLQIPAVVRLHKNVHMHKNGVKFSRANVLARDEYRCQYCGHKKRGRDLNYDHVIPRQQGGKTTWTNIASACHPCNLRKRNRTPEQAGMPLLRKPFIPKVLPIGMPLMISVDSIPRPWQPYLDGQGYHLRTG
jgi:5-methylcytosine-specific restriction endonuclease McrA